MDITALYHLFLRCQGVTTDSRNCPAGSLFIALKGDKFNGNAFAANALASGCAYAVVDEDLPEAQADDRYIRVDNCLLALQQLARHHRRQLGTRLLAITGTNGKTTTKELIATVLSQRFNVLYTQGNLNNHIGVPLTLLRLQPAHQLAVIEMGASHPGDIRELVEIAEPDFGIITNVGKAHLEGFGSFEGVIRTKGELFDYLRGKGRATVFVHDDNPYLKTMAEGLEQMLYGSREGLYVSGHATGCSPYLSLEWQAAGTNGLHSVQTQLIGGYNLPNALAAVAIGHYFGVPAADIDKALAGYAPQNNRSQLKKTAHNTLIIDAYNANPTSMMAALSNFKAMKATHKMLILGDMRELGKDSAAEHRKIVDFLKECGFDDVILVGSEFAGTGSPYATYPDVQALIEKLKAGQPAGKTILIKGSNGIKLSSIVEYL